ncbi:hypothetical protein J2752_000488 [Halarchaeum rubridurum]|uniref:Uncharacterized protein n=1 Tax=Halarchaeum rubridurum TaxID=489911 RepID=A0A830FUP5_9EURY|nr:hypothetical protein [Halarchaeum rubridurum]MBP1953607.1 hypothetical protein [Halarchaeum rubridurum]GGM63966.1 hypothetical protein GCM10009017_12560 [Halarchaeum rubridurum]
MATKQHSRREASRVREIAMRVDLHRLGYEVREEERGVDVTVIADGERGRRIKLVHGGDQWFSRGGERLVKKEMEPPAWLEDVFQHVEEELRRGVTVTRP